MLARRWPIIVSVAIASLLGVAACTPRMNSEVTTSAAVTAVTAVAPETEAVTASAPETEAVTASDVVTASSPVSGATQVQSTTQQAIQSTEPSETSPGAASGESQAAPGTEDGEQPGPMTVFADSTYKFSVNHPDNFVLRTQPAEKLSQLTPRPDASFIFMNPVTAASDLGDLEPADLEVRVYSMAQAPSLEEWLTSNGLLTVDGTLPLEAFQAANVSGVEVCASTMIAPGCSYFVMGNGFIYQLTPVTLEGEAMAQTFMLTS